MKASPKKIVVLVVIIAIFCIGALTSRWAARSGYDHINHRSEQTDKPVPESSLHRNRVDDSLSTYSDAGQTQPETENRFLTAWISRSDNNHDQTEPQGRSGDRKLNRFGKRLAQGADPEEGEDPDDGKDTYGDTDVE